MSVTSDNRNTIRRQAWITLLMVIITLTTLYAAAWSAHIRFDLTEDRIYTLSDSTKSLLQQLQEPVQIRAYITSGLPQPYGALHRFITDMLASYHDASSRISYEVIDPSSDPNVAASLSALGIPKVQVQVVEDDQAQVKQGYIAIVISYLDKKETIPVVQSEAGFEYLLTRKIKKVTSTGQLKIGITTSGSSDSMLANLTKVRQLADSDYQLIAVDPDKKPLPDDLSGLIITKMATPPSPLFRYRVEQFRLQGHGVLLLAGSVLPQLDMGFNVQPVDRYTNDWVKEDLGVVVEPGLIIDRDASRVMVNQQQGMFMFRTAVDYPFMPAIHNFNANHIVTKRMKEVALPFASPLACVDESECTVLMRSSPNSAVQSGPPFDVDPLVTISRRFMRVQQREQIVAIAKSGSIKSRL
ncbi:MAG: GldG family protein, partial [Mariprofundales bacterium]|nr:GldG family protein [Mariprofundales bacterium]